MQNVYGDLHYTEHVKRVLLSLKYNNGLLYNSWRGGAI